MKTLRFLIGAGLLFALAHLAPAGPGPSLGKNPPDKNPPVYVPPPPPILSLPKNRIGVLATGGFGVETEFVSDAYVKKDPKKPLPLGTSSRSSDSDEDDFSGGFEVFYERLFTEPTETNLWGLRIGLGYSEIDMDGEIIGETALQHSLEADLIYLNVGPFYEHRFTTQFYGQLSAGLTAAYINADLKTDDSGGLLNDDVSDDDFLFGAYASVALGYDFTPHWGITGGVRYQYLDSHEIDNGTTKAKLDFDSSFYAFLGLRFTF